MPAATPQQERVQALADRALNLPDGLIVDFSIRRYGDLQACYDTYRRFIMAFSSMRAKRRRKAMTLNQKRLETVDTDFKGPYDSLAVYKTDLPNGEGYRVHMVPAAAMDFAFDVKDAKTLEPMVEYSPAFQKRMAIVDFWSRKATEHNRASRLDPTTTGRFLNPLSEDQEAYWFSVEPQEAQEFFDAMGVKPRAKLEAEAKPFDLADIELGDDWGTNDAEG